MRRPWSTVFGVDAYPTLFEKEAALLHFIAPGHALVHGNKQAACLSRGFDVDAAEMLVNEAAAGAHDGSSMAGVLAKFTA